jgi:hypothetical protein
MVDIEKKGVTYPESRENMITFEQLRTAFGVFSGDYNIVNHPDTLPSSPFEHPNEPVDHEGHMERQYNLTQIPVEMTEEAFLEAFNKCDTIFISCMDKDAVGPSYDALKEQHKNIFLLSMAGGVIQEHPERAEALDTILKYLGQYGSHIQEVYATDHNNTCGYIKFAIAQGKSLAEILKTNPASAEEDRSMKRMILSHAQIVKKYFGNKVIPALVQIDRLGKAWFDLDFKGIEPARLNEVITQ